MLMHFSAALRLKANWTEIDNAVSDSRSEKVNIWTKFPLNPSQKKTKIVHILMNFVTDWMASNT